MGRQNGWQRQRLDDVRILDAHASAQIKRRIIDGAAASVVLHLALQKCERRVLQHRLRERVRKIIQQPRRASGNTHTSLVSRLSSPR